MTPTTATPDSPGTELIVAPAVSGGASGWDRQIDLGALLAAAPGLARIAAAAYVRSVEWTVTTGWRGYVRLARAAASGQSTADLMAEARSEARSAIRSLLDLADIGGSGSAPQQRAERAAERTRAAEATAASAEEDLRRRGADLLRRSADVRYNEDSHPAYARILDELAPDEARVLRFLSINGPQPSVDVRAGRTLSVGTNLIAPGLSMIGAQAGCRHVDRIPAYLNNLYRLGLIWFSRESLEDPLRYQVLEAQPDVLAAMKGAGRRRTVRRSIHLTPFGEDFCEMCLPPNGAN